jgi:hypothetical protein
MTMEIRPQPVWGQKVGENRDHRVHLFYVGAGIGPVGWSACQEQYNHATKVDETMTKTICGRCMSIAASQRVPMPRKPLPIT